MLTTKLRILDTLENGKCRSSECGSESIWNFVSGCPVDNDNDDTFIKHEMLLQAAYSVKCFTQACVSGKGSTQTG
jgi:hypothetical protein